MSTEGVEVLGCGPVVGWIQMVYIITVTGRRMERGIDFAVSALS